MNNIFKIIWNQATQLFVVTSELAKGKAKSSSHSPSAKAESSSMPTYSLLSTSILFGLLATNANAAVVEQNNSNAITNITTDTGIVIGQGASAYGEGTSISRDLIAIGNNAKATERTKRVTLFHYRTPGNMDWRDITGRLTNIDVDPLWGYSLGAYDNNEFIARAAPSMALGYESYAFGGSVAMGAYSHAGEKVGANNQNSLAVAIGSYTTATGNGAVAMGPAASAQGNNSFALMRQASATGGNAMALGAASYASTDGAIAIGRIATSTGKNAIAIGTGGEGSGATSYLDRSQATTASGDNSIALGHNVNVTTTDSIAIGRESKAHQDNSVALGALSETRAATAETTGIVNGFTYGNFAAQGSTANGVVSIGKAGAERQLVNVAAGKVSSDSTDAINGSQLFMTNRGLSYLGDTLVTNVLGGNAAVEKSGNTLGTLTMSNIGGTGKNTIDEAIKAAKTEVKAEKQATVSKADGANGQAIYTVGATKTTLNAGTKVSVTGGTEDASGILAYTVGLDAATNDKIDSIGSGNVAAGDTNTVTGATVYNYIQSNPITFVGEDNTNPVKTKLGETIKFTGGDVDTDYKGTNIKVKSNGSEIVVGFKDAPTFTNITADSLNISNGGPTINKDGINMNNKKITNVAAGEADTDAVNVAQLKEAKANIANIANNVQLLEDNSPFEYAVDILPALKDGDSY
ncbi:ESPR-type extended signal peptide-containing protein [Aggregatibacter kilianii]|uniref:ESPR-type extended signal peptide-containing protein n=1 Tax=Aggregatibacter kilianii TaxID=2025884 RepID=UPI000D652F1F|nr:ESPR-type extended signal peptide-containing protein [Aggregatibacter kilianii]